MSNPVSVVPVKEWSPAFVQSSARVGSSSGRDIDQTLAIVTTGNGRPSEVRYEDYSLSSKPAQAITPIILGNAASKRVAPVDVLIGKLQEGDPLWQELFAVLQSKPETLAELSLLGYVFTILRPALQRGGSSTHGVLQNVGQLKFAAQSKVSRDDPIRGRQLLLNVDNFCELRIFTRADKLLKQYQKQNPDIINPLLIGFFPGERIFTSAASGRSSLYSNNPGQALEDRYGNSLRPMDVVTKVFGRSPTKIVQLLLEEEGIIMLSN